ncbi:MAG TPA: hypothetical protein VGW78_06800 [Candidatus Babeliales bacterium]|jgi:hypothetical protein|nr:hypothetical protein [Candidatus Babeliales bacterium]
MYHKISIVLITLLNVNQLLSNNQVNAQKPLPKAVIGRWAHFKRYWFEDTPSMKEFTEKNKKELEEIIQNIENIKKQNIDIRYFPSIHIYTYTGNSRILALSAARTIAYLADMDFAPIRADSLLDPNGIDQLKNFITIANKSSYGLLVYIENADKIFNNSDFLNPESEAYQTLTALIKKNNTMLVITIPEKYTIPLAFSSYFQKGIIMETPSGLLEDIAKFIFLPWYVFFKGIYKIY